MSTPANAITSANAARPGSPRAGGFSIIELIVVIVILGVLGALVAPRLGGLGGRQARADAEAVADLLSIAARRDAVVNRPLAVDYDEERGSLRILAFAADESGSFDWRPDLLAPPASLRSTVVASLQTDGNELDARRWRVEFPAGEQRPSVSILLKDPARGDQWRVDLASGSLRAIVMGAEAPPGLGDGSIDLDAAGRSEEAW